MPLSEGVHVIGTLSVNPDLSTLRSEEELPSSDEIVLYPLEKKWYDPSSETLQNVKFSQHVGNHDFTLEALSKLVDEEFLIVILPRCQRFYRRDMDLPASVYRQYLREFNVLLEGSPESQFHQLLDEGRTTFSEYDGFYSASIATPDDPGMWAEPFAESYPEFTEDVLELSGVRWSIVRLEEANHREVRKMGYLVITELEEVLSTEISRLFPKSRELKNSVSDNAWGGWVEDKRNGLDIHISEHMYLHNMVDFLKDIYAIAPSLNRINIERVYQSKSDIMWLRNRAMHPTKTLIRNRQNLQRFVETVEELNSILP